MKVFSQGVFVGFCFLFLTLYTQQESFDNVSITRAYHLAGYDGVTQQQQHPFIFPSSHFGNLFRFTSFLSGELYVALHDQDLRTVFLRHIDRFYNYSLQGYVLYCFAYKEITQQIVDVPEKRAYLLEELVYLRGRLVTVIDDFNYVMGDWCNDYAIACRINLEAIIKKIDQDFLCLNENGAHGVLRQACAPFL